MPALAASGGLVSGVIRVADCQLQLLYVERLCQTRSTRGLTQGTGAAPLRPELFPFALNYRTHNNPLRPEQSSPHTLMSHTLPTAASSSSSSSNFQLILNSALDTYKKRTKKDLREHPLAAQLQTCDSPSAILAVLQQQAQEAEQSRITNERWTKWLDPTVKVLHAFVSILGAAGGPVRLRICTSPRSAPSFIWQVLPSSNLIFSGFGELLSVCIFINFAWAIVTHTLSGS